MPQRESRAPVRQLGLADAYRRVSSARGASLLAVGLEGCDSCAALTADLADLGRLSGCSVSAYGAIDPDDNDDIAAAVALRVQEYPTLFLLFNGRPVAGWVGYDITMPAPDRISTFSEMAAAVLRKSEVAVEPSS